MAEVHGRRREALRRLLDGRGLDALLVTNLLNVRYLTGFTGSNAALLVTADGAVFCTDSRYETSSRTQVPDLERVIERDCALALAARAEGRTGFESDHVTVDGLQDLVDATQAELARAPGLTAELRIVKDETEIEALRMACAAADRALAALIEHGGLRPGRTEREVARALDDGMRDQGAEGPAFATIVAAGEHSAIPHHQPTDAQLKVGDLVKMDFGALVDGYHSDMTRVVVLGRPADWQTEMHALVAVAQAAGRKALRPGATFAEVDDAARSVIAAAGRSEQFMHGLGHGVGLEIHEAPALGRAGTGTLAAGMAVTVEPGVYVPGQGGVRIEDTLIVREGAPELLTLTTKELVVL
ncbi:MAG TPA: aminopeptidase P family protein [Kutzneria sp.]